MPLAKIALCKNIFCLIDSSSTKSKWIAMESPMAFEIANIYTEQLEDTFMGWSPHFPPPSMKCFLIDVHAISYEMGTFLWVQLREQTSVLMGRVILKECHSYL